MVRRMFHRMFRGVFCGREEPYHGQGADVTGQDRFDEAGKPSLTFFCEANREQTGDTRLHRAAAPIQAAI